MITKFGFMNPNQSKFPALKLALAITAIFFGMLFLNYFFYPSVWFPFIVVGVLTLALDMFSGKPIKRHLVVNFGRAIGTSFHWGLMLSLATLALYSLVLLLGVEKAEQTTGVLFGFYMVYLFLSMVIDVTVWNKPDLVTVRNNGEVSNEPT